MTRKTRESPSKEERKTGEKGGANLIRRRANERSKRRRRNEFRLAWGASPRRCNRHDSRSGAQSRSTCVRCTAREGQLTWKRKRQPAYLDVSETRKDASDRREEKEKGSEEIFFLLFFSALLLLPLLSFSLLLFSRGQGGGGEEKEEEKARESFSPLSDPPLSLFVSSLSLSLSLLQTGKTLKEEEEKKTGKEADCF